MGVQWPLKGRIPVVAATNTEMTHICVLLCCLDVLAALVRGIALLLLRLCLLRVFGAGAALRGSVNEGLGCLQ